MAKQLGCWLNGEPCQYIAVGDRGLSYGDGLFETMKVVNQQPSLWHLHKTRLANGLARLDISCNLADIECWIFEACQQHPAELGVAKLIVTRGGGGRGYSPLGSGPATVLIELYPYPDYPAANCSAGIHLFPCTTRLAHQPLLAGIKHLNRLEQVLARQEWQTAEYGEGLVLDQSGHVVEATMSNVFLVCDNQLITPDLSLCGVEGTCRAFIIEQAEKRGMPVEVLNVTLAMLFTATEVFVCNSVLGIWPVRAYQAHCWPEQKCWPIGHMTQYWQQTLIEVLG
ncbi:aminodeoxychorismate lyase [Zooshikella harenae]|uniref:Aminodeoxychorismate lyase n=1 Tax=Zooshikella harenae TaxID=2827238 RepID=A0ABS5ZEZ2_9GAMM|nr:aminodeoxychorismate lyase [Zooshikella harenae]MBU2711537.1 aminodeoxychorismate lyase [Zooshikella harenae]